DAEGEGENKHMEERRPVRSLVVLSPPFSASLRLCGEPPLFLVGGDERPLGGGARGVAAGGAFGAAAPLAGLDHQPAADRAGRRQRPLPEGEVAGRVAVAAVEDAPALAAALDHDLVLAALRAGHAGALGDVPSVAAL